MSRLHSCPQWDFQVATPKSRSRPPTLLPMSRPQNDVATSHPSCNALKPKPGRDLKAKSRPQIAQSNLCQVATPKRMSQRQPLLVQVATPTGHRDLALPGPGRAHRAPALRAWRPVCHDPKSGSRPNVEFGSSHSSFCLAFFFFLSVAFPATPKDVVA